MYNKRGILEARGDKLGFANTLETDRSQVNLDRESPIHRVTTTGARKQPYWDKCWLTELVRKHGIAPMQRYWMILCSTTSISSFLLTNLFHLNSIYSYRRNQRNEVLVADYEDLRLGHLSARRTVILVELFLLHNINDLILKDGRSSRTQEEQICCNPSLSFCRLLFPPLDSFQPPRKTQKTERV